MKLTVLIISRTLKRRKIKN